MGWNHQLGEITLPETNSEFTPENGCLEYYWSFPFGMMAYFHVRTVSPREWNG